MLEEGESKTSPLLKVDVKLEEEIEDEWCAEA